eukprot:gnl/Dysnectes_brevis/2385_a2824_1352.p1 GENE.gnl/Dysnectes_brevis/2385_a2824_1352~~gnl/Dysnectes_brevis/2385_a2824_1352.p1  ORF type:complete len:271 (+),score=14.80 gnl/Dysnectes_brevis/2385_a2824_1352:76-813(+)
MKYEADPSAIKLLHTILTQFDIYHTQKTSLLQSLKQFEEVYKQERRCTSQLQSQYPVHTLTSNQLDSIKTLSNTSAQLGTDLAHTPALIASLTTLELKLTELQKLTPLHHINLHKLQHNLDKQHSMVDRASDIAGEGGAREALRMERLSRASKYSSYARQHEIHRQQLESQVEEHGFREDLSHASLLRLSSKVRKSQEAVSRLIAAEEEYCGLPADIERARVVLEELKQAVAGLQSRFDQAISGQ